MNKKGGITVFLAITMLLIVALLGTMVELARGKVCQVHSRRTLRMAAECLLAEYSRPLYEQYHLFFLEDTGVPFEQCIARYASDTLTPTGIVGEVFDLYDGVLSQTDIEKKRYIGENGGEALLYQVEKYMKCHLVQEVIEQGLNRHKQAEDIRQSAEDIDEKVKTEQQAAEAGIQLISLMELVDGVSCGMNGVKGKKYFVKMFYSGEKKPENLGVTESLVWNEIKDNMINLKTVFANLDNKELVQSFLAKIEKCLEKTEEALKIMKEMEPQLATLKIGSAPICVLENNRSVLEQSQEILMQEITEAKRQQLMDLWKQYDTTGIVFSYEGINEHGGGENPLEHVTDVLKGSILDMVLADEFEVSSKVVEKADGYGDLYGNEQLTPDCENKLEKFANEQKVELQGVLDSIADTSLSEYLLCEYGKEHFAYLGSESRAKGCLDYELEYIISGKKSDRKNLEQVVNRIFLMRTAANTAVLFATSSKRETAYAAAMSIVGFTGVEPLVRLTQTMLMVAWGMVEAFVDVAGLLQGKHISLVKTAEDIVVDFSDLFQFNHSYVMKEVQKLPKEKDNSFGYEAYLTLFMMGNKTETLCYRMMDVMQWNIRKKSVEKFDLGMCVDSFEVNGTISFSTKFFRFPGIQQMLERELNDFSVSVKVPMSYVKIS